MSALHHHELDQSEITAAIFDPTPYREPLVREIMVDLPNSPPWVYQNWEEPWDARLCFHKTTVWFPPPEIARQALVFALKAWCEAPTTTAALFVVPRVVTAFWWGLSKHLVQLPSIYPLKRKMDPQPVLPIPICVLYLPPYVHCHPPPPRLERAAAPQNVHWHRQQAALMRGLPTTPLDPKG